MCFQYIYMSYKYVAGISVELFKKNLAYIVFNQLPKAERKFRSQKVVYMNIHPICWSLEDLTAACSRFLVFWDVTLCGWVIGSRTLNR